MAKHLEIKVGMIFERLGKPGKYRVTSHALGKVYFREILETGPGIESVVRDGKQNIVMEEDFPSIVKKVISEGKS